MYTVKQVEDAARCKFAQGCNRKCCFYYEQELGDGDIADGCSLLVDELGKTALAYREILERLYTKAESMFSYVEDSEAGYDPGTYDPDELGEIEELLEEVEALLKESEVEEG